MGTQTDRVRFNVRGKIFETTAKTLAKARRNQIFGAMFDDEWNLQQKEANKEYFIDRNPDCFSALLDLLGTGELHVPPNVSEKLLYREAQYYGLLDHVRTAKFCELDFNRLKLTSSVRGQGPWYHTGYHTWYHSSAIRASPDGGCAVAHGSIVHVYDWMLEEHPPINLDYKRVSGIEWIDSENIVMGCKNVSRGGAGMGVFSASTGELRHTFHLYDGKDEASNFAEALCFNSEGKIFASCIGKSSSGIGVWDQVTGKQIEFFDLPLATANKIQWLNGSNCLYVSTLFRDKDYRINLLDFRDKSIVWSRTNTSWTDTKTGKDYHVVDTVPIDESHSICLVDYYNYEGLGFLDLRSTDVSVRWSSLGPWAVNINHPKLTFHGGKLFCSMDDKISVYNGGLDQWVLTSSLERSKGGSIRDFSIGGDRLFALHSEENVFDVWETPSAPIL